MGARALRQTWPQIAAWLGTRAQAA
jgi:hypothetical protein